MSLSRVAIIADDRLQQHLLNDTLVRLGFQVVFNLQPDRIGDLQLHTVETDVWLVDIYEDGDSLDWLEHLLDGHVPVLIGMERAPQKSCPTFLRWEKRLLCKLRELTHAPALGASADDILMDRAPAKDINNINSALPAIPLPDVLTRTDVQEPLQIWVLGASLGGPEAVKQFLDALPSGLPIAFVYAQHIDPRFEHALCSAVGRHGQYNVRNFENGLQLQIGDVLVAPIEDEFQVLASGVCQTLDKAWPGPYGPSIDQVLINLHAHYQHRFNCILFSGMGSDGSEAILGLSDCENIWVQTPENCASGSMPESAIGTGRVTFIGTPYQLALQLVQSVKQHWVETHDTSRNNHSGKEHPSRLPTGSTQR